MLRVAFNLRPMASQILVRPTTARAFSTNFRPNSVLVALRERSLLWSKGSLDKGSRSIMIDRPVVQQVQGMQWQRLALTAVRATFLLPRHGTD